MNRSLEDYSPWCHKESDMSVRTCMRMCVRTRAHTHTHRVGFGRISAKMKRMCWKVTEEKGEMV